MVLYTIHNFIKHNYIMLCHILFVIFYISIYLAQSSIWHIAQGTILHSQGVVWDAI